MLGIRHNPLLMFTVIVSIFGVLTTVMFAFNPPITHENFLWRRPLVGSLFSLVCVLGVSAALFPKHCSNAFHFRAERESFDSHKASSTSRGHHPDCEEFAGHVIRINSRTLCAACTGLLLGALVSLLGTAFYFFGDWRFGEMSFAAVLMGAAGLALGLFQLEFRGFTRSMLNAVFVLGAFLMLAGIDELAQSLFIDFFLMALIVFWILTRILLSRWDHRRICSDCKSPCGIREQRKK